MMTLFQTLMILLLAGILLPGGLLAASPAATCTPTDPDMLGPFYVPDAPLRASVGTGYRVKGTVRSRDCAPIPGARIELWLAGPNSIYDNDHRATIIADSKGSYRFESNVPPPYAGRPPHIHLRVTAKGYRTLVTQHYPEAGRTEATFDIVLVPSTEHNEKASSRKTR